MATSSKMSLLKVGNAISQLTTEEMRHLVFQLGVHLREVDNITEQYSGELQKVHLVQKWLDTDPDASWDKLFAGLRIIGKNALATKIECEYLTKVPVASSGSASLPSTSSVSAPPIDSTFKTGTPAPVFPSPSTSAMFDQKVEETKATVEYLQHEYYSMKSDVVHSLSAREATDPHFFHKFQDYLLDMAVTRKQVHIQFFTRNKEQILEARTIRKIFAILNRYCNYSNYEIIFHIVKAFCQDELKRMESYRDSLTSFEKSTTVDVYLCAISARPGGKLREGFTRMCMKINKPTSECTLYEIRELKESIEEEASLESYAMYIEAPAVG